MDPGGVEFRDSFASFPLRVFESRKLCGSFGVMFFVEYQTHFNEHPSTIHSLIPRQAAQPIIPTGLPVPAAMQAPAHIVSAVVLTHRLRHPVKQVPKPNSSIS